MVVELDRRERRKQETRRALRRAALRLVSERGLEAVTVQDIADAADVSTRTFFNHFACKQDALIVADLHRMDALRDTLAAQPPDAAPLDVLRGVLGWVAEVLAEHAEEIALQKAVTRDNPQLLPGQMAGFASYERALVQDVARRCGLDPDADVYPALAAGAAVAALRAALTVWRAAGTIPLPQLVTDAFDQLAQGLPPPSLAVATG